MKTLHFYLFALLLLMGYYIAVEEELKDLKLRAELLF